MEKRKVHSTISSIFFSIRYICKISKASIALMMLTSLFSVVLVLLNIYVIKRIMDALAQRSGIGAVLAVLAVSFGITIVITAINATIQNLLFVVAREKIHRSLFLDLFRTTTKYGLSMYDKPQFYNDYFYVINNAEQSLNTTLQLTGQSITALITVVSLTTYLAMVKASIFAVSLLGVGASCLFSLLIKKERHLFDINSVPERRKMQYMNRVFYLRDFSKEVRSYPGSPLFEEKFDSAHKKQQDLNWMHGKRLSLFSFLTSGTQVIATNGVMIVLAVAVLNGVLSVSEFVVAQNAASQLSSHLYSLINLLPMFYENGLKVDQLRKFLNGNVFPIESIGVGGQVLQIESLNVEDVCFSYDSNFSLSKISFSAERGSSIAIVGANGAGKSTLAKILCGLYRPTEGVVRVNNGEASLENINRSIWHSKVGAVFQDFQVFAFSIAENILMHTPKSQEDTDRVYDALEFVGLKEKITALPNGIHSIVSKEFSESGIILSGGELQKLALARAYAQDYDVLILDELTSAYDPVSEAAIYELIEKIGKNKITIYVSHRLINMHRMTQVLYMKEGEIIESGTHDELMAKRGEYSKLYETQANKYK